MRWIPSLVLLVFLTLAASRTAALSCPPDSVPLGTVCVDKYEASVWSVSDPTKRDKALVAKLKKGTATLEDLARGGATQLGCDFPPFDHAAYPADFPVNGNWTPVPGSDPPTPGVYAASVPGVLPSACLSWFQAAQACLLSGKRLLTNAEWQDAAAGTPDPGGVDDDATECETGTDEGPGEFPPPTVDPAEAGSRSACVSHWGAMDMVGNVWEWVHDLHPDGGNAPECGGWVSAGDLCLWGQGGALFRGGDYHDGNTAGVFAVWSKEPTFATGIDEFGRVTDPAIGMRCAR